MVFRALAPYVLVVAVTGGGLFWTYHTGYRHGATDTLQDVEDANREVQNALRRGEAQRLELQAEREDLARALEDAARADPVRVPDALSLERVRRLNSLK